MRKIYKGLSLWGDAKALSKSPSTYAKRQVRKQAHKGLAKLLRKVIK